MKLCKSCNNPIPEKRINRFGVIYCSNKCRKSVEKEKYRLINTFSSILPTGTIGAIHELKVCTDLLIKGYEVFRSLSQSCSCDVAILKSKKLLRVEITTGYYTNSKKVSYPPHDLSKYDLLAVVTKDGKIHYVPEL